MLKIKVLPADTYVVINKTLLNNQDERILIDFYQPIIGSIATSLYLTLWSYLNKDETTSLEWTHHHLMTSLRLDLSSVIAAREKLESVGLIKTYVKKDHINNYIYELYSPLSASEFINNPILNIALYNNLGKKEYDNIINYYRVPKIDHSKYEDITCSFSDVFTSIPATQIDMLIDDIKHQNKRELDINYTIDLDNIMTMIPDDILNIKSVTKDTRELIYKLSFVYNFNDDEMLNIIRNSLSNKKIDKDALKSNARQFYKFENGGALPGIIYRSQPEFLRSQINSTSKKAKMIYQFETTSPYDYLRSKNGGNNPIKNDLLIIEYLLVDLGLTPGVVNVLIDYVLRIDSNKLTRKYVEAIAAQWKRSNIKTVEEAMDFANTQHRSKIKSTNHKKTIKPNWLDQEIDIEEASEEEKKRMEEILKEFK